MYNPNETLKPRVVLNRLLAEGIASILIPNFREKQVLMVRQSGSDEVKFEPMQTHKEAAQFFRQYYNIKKLIEI
ncbi:MAG: hypothetical protein IJ379_04705 [Lachnospiraceae bacterium]|nr:hypothetical protein [Lachnospiraceae bacterium]